ncbi:uncharacterized protein FTOL_01404 [Fusarium torulosum]|uniref:Mid2 domain-containing protein n=1 Tax=Fusarium torulosum TaxID=33205 RepID=A0AAE8LZW8_9HYPO|nr:uncharacterized protein FTOL_01404 [Fusarium torulosum]
MASAVCCYGPVTTTSGMSTRTHLQSQSSQATYPINANPPIVEIRPKGIKVPQPKEDEGREEFDRLTLKTSQAGPIGRSTATRSRSTSTKNNDKTSRMIKANLETSSITSVSITLTKPGDPWTTLPDPDEGTTLPWFTDSTATSMATSAGETASATSTNKTSSPTAPEETESPTPPKKHRLSGGQIAGAVIGALLGMAFILLFGCVAVKHRHKIFKRPKPELKPMYAARRETPAVPEPRSQSYFDVSTPNISRILMAAWPDLFGNWRNPSPRPEPEPEVLIPERPRYQAYVGDAETYTSSVYSQDSRVQQMPEIPRPPGNYI